MTMLVDPPPAWQTKLGWEYLLDPSAHKRHSLSESEQILVITRAERGIAAAPLNSSLRSVGNLILPQRFQVCFPRQSVTPPDAELQPSGLRGTGRAGRATSGWGAPRPPRGRSWVWPRVSPRHYSRCHGGGNPAASRPRPGSPAPCPHAAGRQPEPPHPLRRPV